MSICYPKVDSFQHKAIDILAWNVSSLEPGTLQWSCPELLKPERNAGTPAISLCTVESLFPLASVTDVGVRFPLGYSVYIEINFLGICL